MTLDDARVICPSCLGTGEMSYDGPLHPQPCDTCIGRGWLTEWEHEYVLSNDDADYPRTLPLFAE